ncbi:MAG: BMP family ABC transporter substrate-binding protein [Bacilli bacterium]|nr:BMP family ABC transporter substrate-binding protein [Bacilli bacterium]
MKKQTRILLALSAGLITLGAAGCAGVNGAVYTPGNPVKVGLICVHNDQSTYDKNFIDSMTVAAKNLGKKIDGNPIIKTDVDETNDCYTAAKDLVKQGCNVIFADSFGHEDFMLKAAKEWPSVTFCHATGTKAKVAGVANYHNAFASIYEGRYLAGYAAGLDLQRRIAAGELKESNYRDGNVILGYVGAFPYAEVVSGYTSWFLGVREVVKNVVMDVTFTSSWYDFNAEKNGARTLAERGAALISQHADSMGAPGECATMGVPNITYNVPTPEVGKTYLGYSKIDWAPYYENVVNSMFAGNGIEGETNNNWTGTAGTGSVVYDCVNAQDKILVEGIKAELVAGTRKVFDCAKFTVDGKHLTSYLADVDDDGTFTGETEAIVTQGGITFFNESAYRSAPYFDIKIDGIAQLNN